MFESYRRMKRVFSFPLVFVTNKVVYSKILTTRVFIATKLHDGAGYYCQIRQKLLGTSVVEHLEEWSS